MPGRKNRKTRKTNNKKLANNTVSVEAGLDGKTTFNFKSNSGTLQKPTNSSSKPTTKISGLPDIHQKFLHDVGLNIYAYARSQGYSPYGALLLLALSAQESGYGTEASLGNSYKYNNYWGIKTKDGKHNRKFASKDEGEAAGVDLISKKYTTLANYLRKGEGSLEQLDNAMNAYNKSPNGKKYATWLFKNVMRGVQQRALKTIADEIAELQGEMKSFNPNYISDISHTPLLFLTSGAKAGLNKIDAIQSQINDLQHIQQELQTGHAADTNYFTVPDANTWYNKRKGNTDSTGVPLYRAAPLAPELEGMPLKHSLPSFSQNSLLGQNAYNDNIPGTDNFSPFVYAGSGLDNAGGGTSVSFHTTAAVHNVSHSGQASRSADLHDAVVAVLTSAVADAKIGTDIH